MGMFDFLGGLQIKAFYMPIFHKGQSIIGDEPGTYHSGGRLRSYKIGDPLPLHTECYKYPDNFIFYDYRYDECVWVIKNGALSAIKACIDLTNDDMGDAVYDYYGDLVNIKSPQEFILIQQQWEERIEAIKNDRDNAIEQFDQRWALEHPDRLERQFGEYLYCYLCARSSKDAPVDMYQGKPLYDYYNEYLTCKAAFRSFILANEGIIEKYNQWVDDTIVDTELVDLLVKEVLEEENE